MPHLLLHCLPAEVPAGCGKTTVEPAASTTSSFAVERKRLADGSDLLFNARTYAKAGSQACTVPKLTRLARPTFGASVVAGKDGRVSEIHSMMNWLNLFQGGTPAGRANFVPACAVGSRSNWASFLVDNYTADLFTVAHIHPN